MTHRRIALAAFAAAAQVLDRAIAHGEPAGARLLMLFPKAKTEHHGNGRLYVGTVAQLAAKFRELAADVVPKGTGWFWTAGVSTHGVERKPGSTLEDWLELTEGAAGDVAACGRKRDIDCTAIHWLVLDADDVGDWHALLRELGGRGIAAVLYRSPSHGEFDAKKQRHLIKWRVAIPLRAPWKPRGNLAAEQRRWKGELYPAARAVLGALAELSGLGFDPNPDALMNRWYPPSRRSGDQPLPEVIVLEGVSLDIEALHAAAAELGCVPPAGAAEAEEQERRRIAAEHAARLQSGELEAATIDEIREHAREALKAACKKILAAIKDTRHDTIRDQSWFVGTFVTAGVLDWGEAFDALVAAADAVNSDRPADCADNQRTIDGALNDAPSADLTRFAVPTRPHWTSEALPLAEAEERVRAAVSEFIESALPAPRGKR